MRCTRCKTQKDVKHRCIIKLNPDARDADPRCLRCVKKKWKCTIAPVGFRGAKSSPNESLRWASPEGFQLAMLFQTVAAARRADQLALPESVHDAVRMLRGVHELQNVGAKHVDFEETDQEDYEGYNVESEQEEWCGGSEADDEGEGEGEVTVTPNGVRNPAGEYFHGFYRYSACDQFTLLQHFTLCKMRW